MKRFFALFVLSMLMLTVLSAQTEHLKFKGIPIDGSLDSFVDKLIELGYEYIGTSDGNAVLTGNFAGVDNCFICVTCMGLGYRVTGTSVMFPEKDKWNDLVVQYETYKELLTKKYGEPGDCVERVPEYAQSDLMKIFSIREGTGLYRTSFEVESGSIGLTINTGQGAGAAVCIMYLDKTAIEGTRKKMMDDL